MRLHRSLDLLPKDLSLVVNEKPGKSQGIMNVWFHQQS